MKKLLLTSLFAAFSCVAMAQPKVYYVDLKANQGASPIKEYEQVAPEVDPNAPVMSRKEMLAMIRNIDVFPSVKYQTMQGIGGCFNEIGGIALMSLPKEAREEVMSNLFSKEGSAFAMCRTAVGSSDFGVSAYSYADTPNDYNMDKFSIEREMTSVIPYIQMALKYNPEMKLFASPWSPPAWMKQSGLMDKGDENRTTNRLIKDPKIYSAYAKYFRKYVEAYAKQGIRIDRICVQNETDANTKYPSNTMEPDEMYDIIANYMRPEFDKHKIKTEIWAGTFRTARGNLHGVKFAANKKYADAVDGLGVQYTTPLYIADIRSVSNKPIMHTECICYGSKNTVAEASSRFKEVATYINGGCDNFAYWNMILDQTKKSGWGWTQNSLINIDTETKKVTYNPDYTVMSLMSRFIPEGSVRVAASPSDGIIAVRVGDKDHVIIQNDSDKVMEIGVSSEGKPRVKVYIPAKALSAIVY